MLRVKTGDIYHYGIFVSEDEIIQFGPTPSERLRMRNDEIKVISTDIDAFLVGGFLEVAEFDKKEKKKNRKPNEVVSYAKASLGKGGYNILYNNCEHFANECVTGQASSSQTDGLRNFFRSIPIVDVFTAKLPESCDMGEIYPVEREDEINAASNERVKREKYCAWRLLKYAMQRSLGIKMENVSFTKEENGKWTTPACYFSISHSSSMIAVAVSRTPIGIDVESFSSPVNAGFAQRILTDDEAREYGALPDGSKDEYLITKWSAKEAIFKQSDDAAFAPGSIVIDPASLYSKTLELDGVKYSCAVATQTPEKTRFFEDIPTEKYL